MKNDHGIFVISLDLELYWGLFDVFELNDYKSNLEGVADAIKQMLESFNKYNIHATWATVGAIIASDTNELKKYYPKKQPGYTNKNLSPYQYISKSSNIDNRYHFAPELIDRIISYEGQEIGTHTFSHYYCLEPGQNKEEFKCDIQAAIAIANTKNIKLKSIIFPRNQCNPDYLPVLYEHGINCYRGNEKGWLHKAVSSQKSSTLRRALRLIDTYFNISGQNCYTLTELSCAKPYNVPASRFLRPFNTRFESLEWLRMRRIKRALYYAAKNGEIFHLWWHPHNFGVNTDKNIAFLESILRYYQQLNEKYGMQSLNMGEVSELIDSVSNYSQVNIQNSS